MPNKESWIEEFDKEFDHYENGDSWCDSYDNKECSCFVARVKTFIQKIVIPQVKEQVMKEVMMCVLEEKDLKEVIVPPLFLIPSLIFIADK